MTGFRFFENSIIRSQVIKHNLKYFSTFVTITPLLIANSRENRTHRSMEMRADNDSATCSFEGTLPCWQVVTNV
jgi:hypothetical protein